MLIKSSEKIQIILTVDGVPYAKTDCVGFLVDTQNRFDYKCLSDRFSIMASKLIEDIEEYGNEGIEDSKEDPQGHV